MQTTGEGNSKKIAKKHAAEAMVTLLEGWQVTHQRKSPPQEARRSHRLNKRSPNEDASSRRKPRNLVKEFNASGVSDSSNEEEGFNPISRLLRMQQATKKAEPVYSVIEERGHRKGKEFIIEVECNGLKAQGTGPNKKVAKRMAAKNYLVMIGVDKEDSSPPAAGNGSKAPRKVSFKPESPEETSNVGGSAGRQLVPGLLLMNNMNNMSKCESKTRVD